MWIWKDQNIFEPLALDDYMPPLTYLYIDKDFEVYRSKKHFEMIPRKRVPY